MMGKLMYKKPQSVKDLEKLSFEAKLKRFPNFPYPPKKNYRDDNANGLTACIVDFVALKGGQAERINSTGRMIDNRKRVTNVLGHSTTIGSVKWIKGSGKIGTADISATIQGLSVKIEVKIGNDRQSEAQKQYQADVERAGGIYFIAKDFTSFVVWFNKRFEQ